MKDIWNIHLRQLQGRLGDVVYELAKIQHSSFQPVETAWRPAINAYGCQERYVIRVDLAGVDKSQIDLRVEPRRLVLRGQRAESDLNQREGPAVQILALEIDGGPFEREIAFPRDVAPDRVQAEQRNGLLWIFLPFATPK